MDSFFAVKVQIIYRYFHVLLILKCNSFRNLVQPLAPALCYMRCVLVQSYIIYHYYTQNHNSELQLYEYTGDYIGEDNHTSFQKNTV